MKPLTKREKEVISELIFHELNRLEEQKDLSMHKELNKLIDKLGSE